jgi:phenylacetate-coenzyme A ligase PaaK-like adenylate-forming protein
MNTEELKKRVFEIKSDEEFHLLSLEIFKFQYQFNDVYRHYCHALETTPDSVANIGDIPFLPVEFFKQHIISSSPDTSSLIFSSSGTTGSQTSRHFVAEPDIYHTSFTKGFRMFFGDPVDYHILALLPGYLEREGSSLIYMTNDLIRQSRSSHSGFYLNEYKVLRDKINNMHDDNRKILLLGVSFALLDMAEQRPVQHPRLIIMETGGMKGRRKEMIREELHMVLKIAFGVDNICSEYGMTEMLSQAYSHGNGLYSAPPWMKVLIRETNDPFSYCPDGVTGGVNIIDLANIFSCSFIATQDLGSIKQENSQFEITGRFDSSDIRGCNLLI